MIVAKWRHLRLNLGQLSNYWEPSQGLIEQVI